MISYLIRPVRQTVQALLSSDTPGQLAAGFTVGMLFGLVPKGNLIAVSICILLFSLRINKGLGLVAAILFSWVGMMTDPLSHELGLIALSVDSLEATYASMFNMPLGPWLEFNNTVVMGTLMIGALLALPVYVIVYFASRWTQPRVRMLLDRRRTQAMLDGYTQPEPVGTATS